MSAVLQAEVRRHRLTVDDFHRMCEAGIFRADERVELIENTKWIIGREWSVTS